MRGMEDDTKRPHTRKTKFKQVVSFKLQPFYYPGISLEELRKTTINLSQYSRSPCQDLNPWPSEYEAVVLTTGSRRSMTQQACIKECIWLNFREYGMYQSRNSLWVQAIQWSRAARTVNLRNNTLDLGIRSCLF
jgi:hypothetical protein